MKIGYDKIEEYLKKIPYKATLCGCLDNEIDGYCSIDKLSNTEVSFIVTDSPKAVFFSILHNFYSQKKSAGIAKSSVVKTKNIGKNASIGDCVLLMSQLL